MGILKLHKANINQLKGHIKAKGPSTIHGDGNIYPAPAKDWTSDSGIMNHSYNNATFSNPARDEAQYFKTYNTIAEVPDTVEELEKELIANKFAVANQKRSTSAKPVGNTFAAYEDDDSAEKEAKAAADKAAKEEKAAQLAAEKEAKAAADKAKKDAQ